MIEYEKISESQKGLCKICRKSKDENGKTKKNLAVDHCHETGKVRGLLCMICNTGLGKFNDDPDILERAIKYLRGSND